jgi:hypothetical protein
MKVASQASALPEPQTDAVAAAAARPASFILGVALVKPGITSPAPDLAVLGQQFPHVNFTLMRDAPADVLGLSEREWRAEPLDFHAWDARILRLQHQPRWLGIALDGATVSGSQNVVEILTRYQRLVPRTNAASQSAGFGALLAEHRALHDLSKPPMRADYEHALDVWQWVLRLEPRASEALQLAALFHDIERLFSAADVGREQEASDYQALKDMHARIGASVARRVLMRSGLEPETAQRVAILIQHHERPCAGLRSEELALLADADALSFFSLSSPAFADHYGPAHARKKVRYSLLRMTERARQRLLTVRLRADIARYVAELARARTKESAPEVGAEPQT